METGGRASDNVPGLGLGGNPGKRGLQIARHIFFAQFSLEICCVSPAATAARELG